MNRLQKAHALPFLPAVLSSLKYEEFVRVRLGFVKEQLIATPLNRGSGVYQLEKFEVPEDGSFYAPSIRKFCTQPVSGEVIQGLAEKVIASDSCSEELARLQDQHLANHLHKNGIRDAVLLDPYKKVEFSLKDYYK